MANQEMRWISMEDSKLRVDEKDQEWKDGCSR